MKLGAQVMTKEGELYLRIYHSPSRQIGVLFDAIDEVSEGILDISLEDFKTTGASDAIVGEYRIITANPSLKELNQAVKKLKKKNNKNERESNEA